MPQIKSIRVHCIPDRDLSWRCLLRVLIITLCLLGTACGSDSFDPNAATLTGTWHFSEQTTPVPGQITADNPCDGEFTMAILADTASIQIAPDTVAQGTVAQADTNGTLQCSVNGQTSAPSSGYMASRYLLISRAGAEVTIPTSVERRHSVHRIGDSGEADERIGESRLQWAHRSLDRDTPLN